MKMGLPPVLRGGRLADIALLDQVVHLIGGVWLGDADAVGKLLDGGAAEQIDHIHGIGLRGAETAVPLPQETKQALIAQQPEALIALDHATKQEKRPLSRKKFKI